jgi:hypothetical protein
MPGSNVPTAIPTLNTPDEVKQNFSKKHALNAALNKRVRELVKEHITNVRPDLLERVRNHFKIL